SRINYVIKSPHEGIRLQKLVVDKLNELASGLCSQACANVDAIVEAVVVSNTAMHHLLLGLPVRQLALTPFTAAASLALDIKAYELGINIAPGAYIHFPSIIRGFVGSDHVAMLLSIDSRQVDGLVIALDIGTNTEISLVNGEEITTTSCASGPAFEGGHIKHGMRAAKGAIERLRITKDAIHYQTIDEAPPVGICGSGALDALAQLYLAGVIDNSGRLRRNHPRVRMTDNQAEFLLVDQEEQDGHPVIVITQKDIRELQLANAAIRTGIQLLLETNGFTEEQIRQVVIAGAFGSYIDVSSAVTVGLLPSLPLNKFHQVGNAAGMGAKLALVSLTKREEAQAIASRTRYIELASNPDFKQTFIETSHIGRYRIKGGKREVLD
ncbi:MAG: ASKHA domain-containing protein, partial [Dehalococcoidales bacterium]|nr:ASKHA domain-containing protein [Dehalococcoidales bacterium]